MPILILILLIFPQLPYFQQSILPRHDTFFTYSTFYHFYNHFYYYNVWPQWMPKITYGIPDLFFQFLSLSPLSYVVMLTGKLFGITDAMLLFKMTILLEEAFFILSLYFLMKTILKDRFIATAISISSMISMEAYSNISLNLRIVYFVPLALLFLWHFVKHGDSKYFWMMALVCVLGIMGNSIYVPIVGLYMLLVSTGFLCFKKKIKLSLFLPRGIWTQLSGALTVLLILLYTLVMFKIFADLSVITRGAQAQNTMNVFLSYGRTLNLGQLFSQLFLMGHLYSPLGAGIDNTLYVGMMAGIFFIAALIYCRDVFFSINPLGINFHRAFVFGRLFDEGILLFTRHEFIPAYWIGRALD